MHAVPRISPLHLTAAVTTALRRNPVAALLGPRQCGKTTLARTILRDKPGVRYFALEDPAVLQILEQPATVLGNTPELLRQSSETLAGRIEFIEMGGFDLTEAGGGMVTGGGATRPASSLMETLFTGFYPSSHDKGIPPGDWLRNYFVTYLERDVPKSLNVGDLEAFGLAFSLPCTSGETCRATRWMCWSSGAASKWRSR